MNHVGIDLADAQVLYQLDKSQLLPSFVKSADESDLVTDDGPFAGMDRKYPIHSRAAVWFSGFKYAQDVRRGNPRRIHVEKDLQKAAAVLGEPKDGKMLQRLLDAPVTTADDYLQKLADDQFAYVSDHSGEKIRRAPMRDRGEIIKAASWFLENKSQIPAFEDRQRVARRILKKAEDAFSMKSLAQNKRISPTLVRLEKLALEGEFRAQTTAEAFTKLAEFLPRQDEVQELARKLRSCNVETLPQNFGAQLIKTAEEIVENHPDVARVWDLDTDLVEAMVDRTPLQKLAEDMATTVAPWSGVYVKKDLEKLATSHEGAEDLSRLLGQRMDRLPLCDLFGDIGEQIMKVAAELTVEEQTWLADLFTKHAVHPQRGPARPLVKEAKIDDETMNLAAAEFRKQLSRS